jgi:AraC-like DNA-binding protein/copper chaperone CopZ
MSSKKIKTTVKETVLFIKNMVCPRCIKAVRQELEQLNYEVIEVSLGVARVKGVVNEADLAQALLTNGFELLNNKDEKLIELIKTNIIALIQSKEPLIQQNLSVWLAHQLNTDYQHLSTLFSAVEGITIERYFILQRLEKVKELLVYNELSLKEIAFQLGFSSIAHLSAQFKKMTGFTTTYFKEMGSNKRKSLDNVIQPS